MTTVFVDKFRVEITGKRYFYVYDLDDTNVFICLGLDKLIRFFTANGISRYYIDKFIKCYDQYLIEVEKILYR